MGGKLAIAAGLVAGTVAGAILLGGLVLMAPPAPTPAPADTASPPSSAPSALPSPSSSGSAPASPSSSVPPSSPSPSSGSGAFGIGSPAPPLVVSRLGGGTIDLATLKGKPVWVNFMATWCPSCQDELPLMAGFAARYADQGLVVIAVDVREGAAAVDAFMKGVGVTFPVGLGSDSSAQRAWGAYALPVHFWIDRDGIVRDGALGGIGPDIMAHGLESILPGVTVTP